MSSTLSSFSPFVSASFSYPSRPTNPPSSVDCWRSYREKSAGAPPSAEPVAAVARNYELLTDACSVSHSVASPSVDDKSHDKLFILKRGRSTRARKYHQAYGHLLASVSWYTWKKLDESFVDVLVGGAGWREVVVSGRRSIRFRSKYTRLDRLEQRMRIRFVGKRYRRLRNITIHNNKQIY